MALNATIRLNNNKYTEKYAALEVTDFKHVEHGFLVGSGFV